MKENKISDGLKKIDYGYSPLDSLISMDDNIGFHGEHLTIVILSCNRAAATIKLLDSISSILTDYCGKILIADNKSDVSEKKILKSYIEKSNLDIKLIEFDKNYGVAGGRNRIIEHIETEWLMNLDNDIYFIKDPISAIQECIAQLGVKFLNLPLLSEDQETVFANGGSLYVRYDDGYKSIGGGSTYEQGKKAENSIFPSLSTFIFGGASVIEKKAFIECGMFDDNMFIGFEDIDFSITVFQKGLKVGNCPVFALVHDHTIDISQSSIEYEKTRFSSEILKKSAEYFEIKHACKVWDVNMEMWLKNRQKDLGIYQKEQKQSNDKKPKIALVVDTEGWCFWNISKEIQKNLSNRYEIEIIPLDIINDNIVELFFYVRHFDLVHFFWRTHLSLLSSINDYLQLCGLDYEWFKNVYLDRIAITTSVYDHLFLDNLDFTNRILDYCDNYTVSSQKLLSIYNDDPQIIKKPQMLITDGVDLSLFKPKKLNRFLKDKDLVVGWVGNSKWAAEVEDFKGFNTILKPVMQELEQEGYPVKANYADRQIKMIAHQNMPDYYSEIDVCICVSKMEGTPNPVLEAMACGVPVITTDVGVVNEVFGKKQKGYILKERTKQALKDKIIELAENRNILEELSKENIRQIQNWDWKKITLKFQEFFDLNINNSNK